MINPNTKTLVGLVIPIKQSKAKDLSNHLACLVDYFISFTCCEAEGRAGELP